MRVGGGLTNLTQGGGSNTGNASLDRDGFIKVSKEGYVTVGKVMSCKIMRYDKT